MDWPEIPLGMVSQSKIYTNSEKYFLGNPDIDTVFGHSYGGSAALELQRNHPQITPITYNAPVLAKSNYDAWMHEDKKPLRFSTAFDPVSMLDYNSRVTYKAPDVNSDFAKKCNNVVHKSNFRKYC